MICRHGCLGAARETAPTNPYQPPLQILTAVVRDFESDETATDEFDMYLANKTSIMLILKAYIFFLEQVRYFLPCILIV